MGHSTPTGQPPRLKICCIADLGEARLADTAGATAIGLVSAMPSGPGVIDDDLIATIARAAPQRLATFLLTSQQRVADIVAQHRRVQTTTIQIVDQLIAGDYAELRRELPGIELVQVIHVTGPAAIDAALAAAPHVDALLLDSGAPTLARKELGGTGRAHDWSISREICDRSPTPVYLAGGLNPNNVAAAIARVRPAGVDVCSGVRTEGRLDRTKLTAFVGAAKTAFGRLAT